MSRFAIANDTMVVTSSYVTEQRMPIVQVSHEDDEEGGSLWQFHCGNGDYHMERMQLVRFDTLSAIDPSVMEVGDLQMGCTASRRGIGQPWKINH